MSAWYLFYPGGLSNVQPRGELGSTQSTSVEYEDHSKGLAVHPKAQASVTRNDEAV